MSFFSTVEQILYKCQRSRDRVGKFTEVLVKVVLWSHVRSYHVLSIRYAKQIVQRNQQIPAGSDKGQVVGCITDARHLHGAPVDNAAHGGCDAGYSSAAG